MSIDKVRQSDWFNINTIALRLVEHTINGLNPVNPLSNVTNRIEINITDRLTIWLVYKLINRWLYRFGGGVLLYQTGSM